MKHQIVLSPEARAKLLRKLKLSWAAYWVLLVAGVALLGAGQSVAVVALLVIAAASIWLASVVADAASSTGGSAAIWGLGTLVLGPFGALLFPLLQIGRAHV